MGHPISIVAIKSWLCHFVFGWGGYRSFYFQQMAMVGSAVTLDIAVQLMEAEQITNEDVMSLISGFSMFLRDPSDHVLGQLLVTINHLWLLHRKQNQNENLSSGFINELQASINLILFFVLFPDISPRQVVAGLEGGATRAGPSPDGHGFSGIFFPCGLHRSIISRDPVPVAVFEQDVGRGAERHLAATLCEKNRRRDQSGRGRRSERRSVGPQHSRPSIAHTRCNSPDRGKGKNIRKKEKNQHTHTHTKEHAHLGDFLPYRLVILFFKITTTEFDLISFFPVCVPSGYLVVYL